MPVAKEKSQTWMDSVWDKTTGAATSMVVSSAKSFLYTVMKYQTGMTVQTTTRKADSASSWFFRFSMCQSLPSHCISLAISLCHSPSLSLLNHAHQIQTELMRRFENRSSSLLPLVLTLLFSKLLHPQLKFLASSNSSSAPPGLSQRLILLSRPTNALQSLSRNFCSSLCPHTLILQVILLFSVPSYSLSASVLILSTLSLCGCFCLYLCPSLYLFVPVYVPVSASFPCSHSLHAHSLPLSKLLCAVSPISSSN